MRTCERIVPVFLKFHLPLVLRNMWKCDARNVKFPPEKRSFVSSPAFSSSTIPFSSPFFLYYSSNTLRNRNTHHFSYQNRKASVHTRSAQAAAGPTASHPRARARRPAARTGRRRRRVVDRGVGKERARATGPTPLARECVLLVRRARRRRRLACGGQIGRAARRHRIGETGGAQPTEPT